MEESKSKKKMLRNQFANNRARACIWNWGSQGKGRRRGVIGKIICNIRWRSSREMFKTLVVCAFAKTSNGGEERKKKMFAN